MKRVLWIEDNALSDLQHVVGPVLVEGRYDLVIAENASEGIAQIMDGDNSFDAVIVDVRLPPGDDPRWIKLYRDGGENRTNARLGLEIIRLLLLPNAGDKHERIPDWVKVAKFAIFTVESQREVQKALETLNVVYEQKTAQTSTRVILEILEKLS